MIRIIDGKRYDTKTAELVASWDNGHFVTEFDYLSEDLYRTRKGAFFVHGEGGARTKYSVQNGNSLYSGERIDPVGSVAAQRLCERHADPATTARLFQVMDA